jgi:hypothetical protein
VLYSYLVREKRPAAAPQSSSPPPLASGGGMPAHMPASKD